ncbi:HD domain-containing protein [Microbacterium trichothecenolyticum]|uniref:HD domain-containing protein n=1 Tax=Microbacterium trichothecenolyticum TaxID=69370 RepID=UPI0035BE156E
MSEMSVSEHNVGEMLRRIARSSDLPSSELERRCLIPRVPELAALRAVPQDPHWHPEGDVLTHSLLAADAAATFCASRLALSPERREVVVLAALFHDVGKPATTTLQDGSPVSPGHAELGGKLLLAMGGRLAWPATTTRAVACIVRNHMVPVSVVGDPTRRAVSRLISRLESAGSSLEEWSVVVEADGVARGPAAVVGRAEPWLRIGSGGA